jgi:prevent-host-death family protein
VAPERAERVGIRELRQHASRFVDLAASGRSVEVTRRGRVVAYLVPAGDATGPLADLVAAGVLAPAEDPGSVADVEPVTPRPGGPSVSDVLRQGRDDERW